MLTATLIKPWGTGLYLPVSCKNEIMPEESDDISITADNVRDVVHANGFNCNFNTRSKREFAESCHFNNILICKYEENESGDYKIVDCYFVSELRKSRKKLEEILKNE